MPFNNFTRHKIDSRNIFIIYRVNMRRIVLALQKIHSDNLFRKSVI